MANHITIGALGGLLFGIIVIWQGAGAAGLVLLFTILGLLLGAAVQFGQRILSGEVDLESLREMMATISGRTPG